MCECCCQRRTVTLHYDGRHFMCAHCRLTRVHPPLEPDCCMPGHVYCDFCGLWMKIGKRRKESLQDEELLNTFASLRLCGNLFFLPHL